MVRCYLFGFLLELVYLYLPVFVIYSIVLMAIQSPEKICHLLERLEEIASGQAVVFFGVITDHFECSVSAF